MFKFPLANMPKQASFFKRLDNIHQSLAGFISAFSTILVLLICIDVLMRYLFSISFIALTEMEWYLFSVVFLLGLSYTFRSDRHVRVDVFYNNFSDNKKAWINRIGIILFLIPFCLFVIYYSGKYAYNSWLINESSPEAGGLPWRFFVKALIPLGYIMLLLQGILFLFKKPETD
jgi:TRAP-type mannitol/chloroaromatic compound transport system permease small subunit